MGDVVHFKTDSIRSLVAGLGDPVRDKLAGSYYGLQILTDDQLFNAFRSTWLGKKIVTIPAMDAVRKGRNWQAEAAQIELIEAEEKRLGFWQKLYEVQIKARLWGGAAIYIGTGDTDPSQPLDHESVGKGGIRYLTVMSRREIVAGQIDQDALSETYGKPKDYQVSGATTMAAIHPSRLAVFVGTPHADPLLVAGPNQGWGDSVLESVYGAMRNADATAANIASLVFEANVDVFRIPDFMASLADESYEKRLLDRFALAATAKGINKALILDKDEEYDRKTIAFATLPEVLRGFLEIVAGAADIPLTRLLGTAPSGLGSNGDHSMSNYHDRVGSMQSMEITPAIYRLDECLIRSALGSRPPKIFYSWAPLEQMSEKEEAEIGKMHAETAEILGRAGLFTSDELRTVVANQLVETSFYPGLDQAIAESGEDWNKELDGGEGDDPAEQQERQPTADAAPRTLYVRRDVLNAEEIIAWAKGQGFKTTLPADDLHVTITYSRQPVDWMKMGDNWSDDGKGGLTIPAGGPRMMDAFGQKGEAKVLLFVSSALSWRHEDMKRNGASWDHEEYQPHLTISYDPDAPDIASVEPYRGKIELGPEIFEPIKEDWAERIEEA